MGSVVKTALALTVSLMIASGAAMAAPAPVVKGDPQAWAEIEAALLKLTHVRSYRVKGWLSGFLGGAVEVVNPDLEHIVTVGRGKIHEWIQIGNDIRWRGSLFSSSGDFSWRCEKSTSGSPGPVDFLTLLGIYPLVMSEVTAARAIAAVVDGVPAQSYTYTAKDYITEVRLFVATATGLPKRIQHYQEKVLLQADFFDYDAPITIELPACRADQHK